MAKLRLTKKAITLIAVGIILLGGGLGYGLWYLNNEASQVATEDSEAAPMSACDSDPNPNDCFKFVRDGDDCKKVRIGGCNDGDGGDAAQERPEAGDASTDYESTGGDNCKVDGEAGVLCNLNDCGKGTQCYTGDNGCNALFRDVCGYDAAKGATYDEVDDSFTVLACESSGGVVCPCGTEEYCFANQTSAAVCTSKTGVGGADIGLCGILSYPGMTDTSQTGTAFIWSCVDTLHDPGGCQDGTPTVLTDITAADIDGLFPSCFCGTKQIDVIGVGSKTKSMTCGCESTPDDQREDPPSTACGDGVLNAGEQCELGDPRGVSCGWNDTCNQNSCTCTPVVSQNPDWSISKFGAGSCVGEVDPTADMDYIVTITNIGAVDGQITTVVDTLDTKVIESEIDLASISPSATVFGNTITWNLTGVGATFAAGESKTYQYSITVPGDEFGTYNNTVVATPVDGDPFSTTNATAVDCESLEEEPDVPETGLFDSMVGRVIAAGMLIVAGLIYMYSDSVWGTTMNIASYFGYDKRLDRARRKFERRLED